MEISKKHPIFASSNNKKQQLKQLKTMTEEQMQKSIEEQYENFLDYEKEACLKIIRDTLNSYVISEDETRQNLYIIWVAKQKRGMTRFLQGTFDEALNRNTVKVIPMEKAVKFFEDYLEKCKKNGIDPSIVKKGGRKPKH